MPVEASALPHTIAQRGQLIDCCIILQGHTMPRVKPVDCCIILDKHMIAQSELS